MKCGELRLTFVGLLTAGCLLAAASNVVAQGQYSPVTDEEVMALRLNHYFTPDDKGHEPDFEWTFAMGEFVMKKGKGAIPAWLREKLVAKGAAADEIRGKWKIESKEGQQLVLTEIKAGGKVGMKEVRLPIYKTAPTVVRIGEVQHGFGIGP